MFERLRSKAVSWNDYMATHPASGESDPFEVTPSDKVDHFGLKNFVAEMVFDNKETRLI